MYEPTPATSLIVYSSWIMFLLGRLGNIHDMDLGPPLPVMKNFREFLLSLDESVDEMEAVKRYNEYKIDFRRQQMQDFFLAHKDEEWYEHEGRCSLSPPHFSLHALGLALGVENWICRVK